MRMQQRPIEGKHVLAGMVAFFGIIIGNPNVKSLLKLHYDFSVVEGIDSKVFNKVGVRGYL